MVQLSRQPQGSLVQETSSRVSVFHPLSQTCYMSASRRLKPLSHLQPGCVIAALECVAAELRTVSYECEDPEEVIDLAQEFLTHTVRYLKKDVKVEVSVPERPSEDGTGAGADGLRLRLLHRNQTQAPASARAGLRSLSTTFWTPRNPC